MRTNAALRCQTADAHTSEGKFGNSCFDSKCPKNAPLGWLGQKNLQNEASYSSDHLGQIGNGSRLIAAEHIRTIGNINPDTLILRTCDRFKRREHGSVGKASIVVENIIIAI